MFDMNLDYFFFKLRGNEQRSGETARLSLCWSPIHHKYLYLVGELNYDEFSNAVVNNKTFIMRVV